MSTRHVLVPRLIAAAALLVGTFAIAPAVGAQTCAYNSTQSTCACPTSGAGTTCFGGQIFRSTDNSCQNDTRPCSSNQNFDCTSAACVCNTASYPCGGCTAASSTIGASCSVPSGGQYTNVCGACSCPSGTTLCSSSNACIANRTCPPGTTWDPCTDTCGTPNVLLSPGWIQSGFIQINGDVKTTAGNLHLDSATGGGQGDTYIANGKAIRVDGSGVTSLSIGNWGVGGTSVNVFHNGNVFATGGFSSMPGDSSVAANTIETGNICFGNGVNCRSSWPTTTDFDSTYVNVTGDTMTGTLTVSGASSNVTVGGRLGVGTTSPTESVDVNSTYLSYDAVGHAAVRAQMNDFASGTQNSIRFGVYGNAYKTNQDASSNYSLYGGYFTSDFGTQAGSMWSRGVYGAGRDGTYATGLYGYGWYGSSTSTGVEGWGSNSPTVTGVYGATNDSTATTSFGVRAQGANAASTNYGMYSYGTGGATSFGLRASAGGSTTMYGVYTSVATNLGQTGTALYADAGTGSGTEYAGVFMNGNVGIGTSTPTQTLDVIGTAKMNGLLLPTGAAAGKVLVSDASGNGTWQAAPGIGGSGTTNYVSKFTAASTLGNSQIVDNGTNVGIGNAAPAQKLDVAGNITIANSGTYEIKNNAAIDTSVLFMDGSNNVKLNAASPAGLLFSISGAEKMRMDSSGNVGIGNAAPAAKLQVTNGSVLFDGATGAIPATGAGTRLEWYPAKSAFRAGLVSGPNWDDAYVGTSSAAVGADTRAGDYSFASGNYSYATGTGSAAFGQSTGASGNYSLGAGYSTSASGAYSAAFGYASTASGTMSFATAQGTASGAGSVAMGQYTSASNSYAQAYGSFTQANGYKSVVLGNGYDGTAGGELINNTGYSIMMGTHSNLPTMTILNSSPGVGSIGQVGIGTTAPDLRLTVSGDVRVGEKGAYTGGSANYGKALVFSGANGLIPGYSGDNSDPQWISRYNSGSNTSELRVSMGDDSSGDSLAVGYCTGYADFNNACTWNPTATFSSNGNVGIGNTGPAYKLDVSGTLHTTSNATLQDTYTDTINTISAGDPLEINYRSTSPTKVCATAGCGTYSAYFDTSGNVGIGTASAGEKLEVNGNLRFTPANPYISASSYFIAPGGAYFNSGTVYTEAAIQARGGIHNDTGGTLVLHGGTSGATSTDGILTVNGGTAVGTAGLTVNGSSGYWGPSVGVSNGSQEWRMVSWSDNTYKVVKVTGSTFTPFTIYNNAYQDELELKSNGISLSGKHAFRSDDSWLRLNQDGAFTSGVHTPGNFAPGALNVGGANGWGNPGGGNSWIAGTETIYGDLSVENNSWGSGSGWIYCGTNSSCWCPGGEFVIAEINYNYYYGYSYIYCAKP